MQRRSRMLLIIFLILVGVSVVVSYYKYILIEDINYEIDEDAFQASLLEE